MVLEIKKSCIRTRVSSLSKTRDGYENCVVFIELYQQNYLSNFMAQYLHCKGHTLEQKKIMQRTVLFFLCSVSMQNKLDAVIGCFESYLFQKNYCNLLGLGHLQKHKPRFNFADTLKPLHSCPLSNLMDQILSILP